MLSSQEDWERHTKTEKKDLTIMLNMELWIMNKTEKIKKQRFDFLTKKLKK